MGKNNVQKIGFCVLFVCMVAWPAIFVNSIFGYLPALMAVLMIIGSYFYLFVLRTTLQYEESSNVSYCVRGMKLNFSVWLKNNFLLTFPGVEPFFFVSNLFEEEDAITSEIITLAPFENRNFDFSIEFEHLGTYHAGLRRVIIQDLLGLFSYTLKNSKNHTIKVIPKIYDLTSLEISRTVVSENEKMQRPNHIDNTDYTGVRAYVMGDSMKNIHWKLSARGENYLTKQFESYTNTGITVILDFLSPKYDKDTLMNVFDGIVESGISIGHYGLQMGLESEILYYNKKGEKKKCVPYQGENYVDLIEDIPRIHTNPMKETAMDLLSEAGNSLYSQGNIVICTANISRELVNTLAEIKNRGKNPLLFAIVPRELSGEARDWFLRPLRSLEEAEVTYQIVSSAEDLQGGDHT